MISSSGKPSAVGIMNNALRFDGFAGTDEKFVGLGDDIAFWTGISNVGCMGRLSVANGDS